MSEPKKKKKTTKKTPDSNLFQKPYFDRVLLLDFILKLLA